MKPGIVKRYKLGYAPDVYFGREKLLRKGNTWGDGSLVFYLRDLGFTPEEIVESGLATISQKQQTLMAEFVASKTDQPQLTPTEDESKIPTTVGDTNGTTLNVSICIRSTAANNTTNGKDANEEQKEAPLLEYKHLLDRFRNRLMIPIFGSLENSNNSNQQLSYSKANNDDIPSVIAFGGRHLDIPDYSSSSDDDQAEKDTLQRQVKPTNFKETKYNAARYLNSPESLIFSKKQTLFVVPSPPTEKDVGSTPVYSSASSIVIVEGYMDAITLASVGVSSKNSLVAASMGTALTMEQLLMASKLLAPASFQALPSQHRHIILCLDSDDAGQNAMERLCSSQILEKFTEQTGTDVFIASLPQPTTCATNEGEGAIKDPAEFVERKREQSNNTRISTEEEIDNDDWIGQAFVFEVLEPATVWSNWYLQRLVNQYTQDPITKQDNFGPVCEDIAKFIARTFTNPADRTRKAFLAAEQLADLIGSDGSTNTALRIQLESDLLDMASRAAEQRDALSRRVGRVQQQDSGDNENTDSLVVKLARGDGVTTNGEDMTSQLSQKALLAATTKKIKAVSPSSFNDESVDNASNNQGRGKQQFTNKKKNWRSNATTKNNPRRFPKKENQPEHSPPIVEHFSGFRFANPSDASWLIGSDYDGKNEQKLYNEMAKKLVIGKTLGSGAASNPYAENDSEQTALLNRNLFKKNHVYFNSNEYIGQGQTNDVDGDIINQYYHEATTGAAKNPHLTTTSPMQQEQSLSSSLSLSSSSTTFIRQDPDTLLLHAETRLLQTLVHFSSARVAMKNAVQTSLNNGRSSNGSTSTSLMEWSCYERGWLFDCLVGNAGSSGSSSENEEMEEEAPLPTIPMELLDGGTSLQIYGYLSKRRDVPAGAFLVDGVVNRVDDSVVVDAVSKNDEIMTNANYLDKNITSCTLDSISAPASSTIPVSNLDSSINSIQNNTDENQITDNSKDINYEPYNDVFDPVGDLPEELKDMVYPGQSTQEENESQQQHAHEKGYKFSNIKRKASDMLPKTVAPSASIERNQNLSNQQEKSTMASDRFPTSSSSIYENVMRVDDDCDSDKSSLLANSSYEKEHQQQNNKQCQGTLDQFFLLPDDELFSLSSTADMEMKADLVVQETMAIMLKATAVKRYQDINQEWECAYSELLKREDEVDNSSGKGRIFDDDGIDSFLSNNNRSSLSEDDEQQQEQQRSSAVEETEALAASSTEKNYYETMEFNELLNHCSQLSHKLEKAKTTASQLHTALDRMGSRVLDYSYRGTKGATMGFSPSVAKLEDLEKEMKEFVESLPEDGVEDEYEDFEEELSPVEKFYNKRRQDNGDDEVARSMPASPSKPIFKSNDVNLDDIEIIPAFSDPKVLRKQSNSERRQAEKLMEMMQDHCDEMVDDYEEEDVEEEEIAEENYGVYEEENITPSLLDDENLWGVFE